jgi:FKBP-type peptidyl-prolyl cis-trans isomerase
MRIALSTLVIVLTAGAWLAACDSTEELIVGDIVIRNISVGTGPEAVAGDSLRVYYVLTREEDGRICDTVVEPDEPFAFRLGDSRLIEGWNQGLEGMKEGGRREVTVPPNLGYGLQRLNSCIRSNETLIFTIDLLEVIKD